MSEDLDEFSLQNRSLEMDKLDDLVKPIFLEYIKSNRIFEIFRTSIFSIGVLTNLLNILIFTRIPMKSQLNKYLLALAICDLFVLLFSQMSLPNDYFYIIESNQALKPNLSDLIHLVKYLHYQWSLNIYPSIYPYTYPLAIMFQIGTVWINLFISINRFIAINFPFKSLSLVHKFNVSKQLKLIFLLSFFLSLPRFFEYNVNFERFVINFNETYKFAYIDLTSFGKSRLFRNLIYFWMYLLFQSLLPLLLMSIINIALILSLKGMFKKLTYNKLNLTQNKELRRKDVTTIMLIIVVIMFIFLQTPALFCNFHYGFNYFRPSSTLYINSVCNIGNIFIITCSSLNFFTYILFYKKYRTQLNCALARIFCSKQSSKKNTIFIPNSIILVTPSPRRLSNSKCLKRIKTRQKKIVIKIL